MIMRNLLILITVLLSLSSHAQEKKSNLITIKTEKESHEVFNLILSELMDQGYDIAYKDNDIKTIKTEPKRLTKPKGLKMYLSVRVKANGDVRIKGHFYISSIESKDDATRVQCRGGKGSPFRASWDSLLSFAKSLPYSIIDYSIE